MCVRFFLAFFYHFICAGAGRRADLGVVCLVRIEGPSTTYERDPAMQGAARPVRHVMTLQEPDTPGAFLRYHQFKVPDRCRDK